MASPTPQRPTARSGRLRPARHLWSLPLSLVMTMAISPGLPLAPVWLVMPMTLGLALILGARGWLLLVYAGFWPALVGLLSLDVPGWWFGAAALLLFALSRHAIGERVPLFLSSKAAVARLAAELPAGARVADMGCGIGSVVVPLARLRPDLHVTGVEGSWLTWLIARLRAANSSACIRYGDIWRQDWQAFDVIYVYLSPVPMPRVWQKFQTEALPGAWLVSNTFGIDGVPPVRQAGLDDVMQSQLQYWISAR